MEVHAVKHYKHIFFDLDHTLWDFEANSRAVLTELHSEFGLSERSVPCGAFIPAYEAVNSGLWAAHESGSMDRETLRALRFRQALAGLGIHDNAMAMRMEHLYMERCPVRPGLMEGALDLLNALQGKYMLHIITNGFTETQGLKLNASGIRHFFAVVLTSEQAGVAKPSPRIFRHALRSAGATAAQSLMIGDSARADMAGARGAGMDHVHLAPAGLHDEAATYAITRLDDLRPLLLQG
ncbi:MAG: YjjG family noncanonical pyrimidine nucleotidase [Flavobacteriales bacterium]